jgi:hypothetical protein
VEDCPVIPKTAVNPYIGRKGPLTIVMSSAKVVEKKFEEERLVQRKAEMVLKKMVTQCMCCRKITCHGACLQCCFKCGSRAHYTRACSLNVPKLLKGKGICFRCMDLDTRVGKHTSAECPLKERLRTLLYQDLGKQGRPKDFPSLVATVYITEHSFYQYIAGLH